MAMLKKIYFEHYKAFAGAEEIELHPITLIVGKNSSGKSSVLKLLPMLSKMVSGTIRYPLLLKNDGIVNATEYEDLFFKRENTGLRLAVEYDNEIVLSGNYYIQDGVKLYSYSANNGQKEITNQLGEQFGLINPEIFSELQIDPSTLQFECTYIGPFRVIAPHNVVFQGFDNNLKIGYNGQEAYQMLLHSYLTDKSLLKSVSQWIGDTLEGQQLDFSNINNNFGTYSLVVKHNCYESNVTGVGQGVAQVIPIITQSFVAQENSINIMEQPALHLHPAAHSSVAYRLGISAKTNRCKYMIESHSENILLGFRHLIVNPDVDFTPDDIVIYFIEDDGASSYLKKITIDEKGELSDWPTGVYGESFELLRQILEMRSK